MYYNFQNLLLFVISSNRIRTIRAQGQNESLGKYINNA
jgi:hypothetical protein